MAHSMAAAAKERKKAQVKEYLRQLKEMVPPTGKRKRGRTGTINALQHVIQSFKKIQGTISSNKHFPSLICVYILYMT